MANRDRPPTPSHHERLQQFLIFCETLQQHPFVTSHPVGGTFSLDASFPEEGADSLRVSFDEIHLESLLTRLRQFLGEGELYYYKDIRRAIVNLFVEDEAFRSFYDKLVAAIHRPFPARAFQVFKANGKDVAEGFSFKQLLEAQLYTGAIHSNRILAPTPGSAEEGLPASHDLAKKQIAIDLARSGLACVANVLVMRNWALRQARLSGGVDLFPELKALDARSSAPAQSSQ